jgi:succinoglycan biosynthesis protein ExoM
METASIDVSICIATFRRPVGLERLLDSLDRLKIPTGVELEILIVDNDSERSASEVVANRPGTLLPYRYLVEPHQNIAAARNRSLEVARGRWLMFIDDDEVADENWLVAYLEMFDRYECDGGFGPVISRLEEIVTPWLDVPTFYSSHRHTTGTTLLQGEPRTSNAMIRRSLFENRQFDPAFGLTGGSDTKLFEAMCRSGARFLWCDEAQVFEYLPAARHRVSWLSRRAFRGGFVHTRLKPKPTPSVFAARIARSVLLLCGYTLVAPLFALMGRRALVRLWLRVCVQAGHLWSACEQSYEEYGATSPEVPAPQSGSRGA